MKIIGINAAGLSSKFESFENLLKNENPSIFCLQETKMKRINQIQTESSKHFTIYELNRQNSKGGGICIGVHKDLRSVWIAEGDDEVECLVVEVWINDFPLRVVCAYGPQLNDSLQRKHTFWDFLERQHIDAEKAGAGFIIQMDSNAHLGRDWLENEVNEQNVNGKLFANFLERRSELTLINSLNLCEGNITRMRKTTKGTERSILDVFITCSKILPYIKKMKIDEKRENTLVNFHNVKQDGRVIETDHNPLILEVKLEYSPVKPDRIEIFQFKNKNSQILFKKMTSATKEFTACFDNNLPFEGQAKKWRNLLNNFFHKSFKKIRIRNKIKVKKTKLSELFKRRMILKKKLHMTENEEEEIITLEEKIAEECEDLNRKKITDNFKELDGNNGNLNHQGVWKTKRKFFPKIKPTLPVGKKNHENKIITNPEELKDLYLETFKFRLRHRSVLPGYEEIMDLQEDLFKLRLELAKTKKTPAWKMADLEEALKSLKPGKCRDPAGLIREIFKEEVIGEDLKQSMLILYNKIKETGEIPEFMKTANIAAIYKGKGDKTDLDSDRGIFLVSVFRTILMKMIYKDQYSLIDSSMSDSNIGARKSKNIRNHIFVVNSIIHDVLSKQSKDPIDIMVLDYKQMFDSECLYECMNDLYEAGVCDDIFSLLFEANRENFVAVQTPNGLTKREAFKEIVMQGDVLAPLISSLQVDTMGKECLQDGKHLYFYKDKVPIPPLGLVDDLFTVSKCGYETTKINQFIRSKTAMKKLQFGTKKCIKLHVGKQCNETLCKELLLEGWKIKVERDTLTGKVSQHEELGGQEKMEEKKEQAYLGDIISVDGKHMKNIQVRKNKSLGTINQIMHILETMFFGKYFFEVALVLRSSLLLSSLLLNSEAWVNLTEKNIRALEQTDEILLSKILGCEANTSNVFKYLELGIYPVRFEIIKRKILFLHYILQQEKTSMIYQVLKVTQESPTKNDFVKGCEQYLKVLHIDMCFESIGKLSTWSFKKLVKERTTAAAFQYLIEEKFKQSKISHLQYDKLEMQDYLLDGNKNTEMSKLIYKARSQCLDIKTQKKWKYQDQICVGCGKNPETGDEILTCVGYSDRKNDQVFENLTYSLFFTGSSSQKVQVAKIIKKRLKIRDKMIEDQN